MGNRWRPDVWIRYRILLPEGQCNGICRMHIGRIRPGPCAEFTDLMQKRGIIISDHPSSGFLSKLSPAGKGKTLLDSSRKFSIKKQNLYLQRNRAVLACIDARAAVDACVIIKPDDVLALQCLNRADLDASHTSALAWAGCALAVLPAAFFVIDCDWHFRWWFFVVFNGFVICRCYHGGLGPQRIKNLLICHNWKPEQNEWYDLFLNPSDYNADFYSGQCHLKTLFDWFSWLFF